jgi:hypothetical protein
MRNLTKENITTAISATESAIQAASYLGVQYRTFRCYAKKYGLFKTNQSGKGMKKTSTKKIPLDTILSGERSYTSSHRLKLMLLNEGIFSHVCSVCKLSTWNGIPISLELDHIDGIHYNNKLNNLRLLCPNCHSQTPTFRSKKRV